MGDGIVDIQLYGYLFALLITAIASTMSLIEVLKQGRPCLLGRWFAC